MTANTTVSEPVIHVVDDDPAVRRSLEWLIESVGLKAQTYASATEFLERYDPEAPGCMVLDVRMPGMSGLELQERLRESGVELPIIVVTAFGDVPMAVRAMKNGAVDFVEKPISDQILLDHIQRVVAEDVARHQQRAAQNEVRQRIGSLTRRERQVMELVVEGLSSRRIAERLGVSTKTVEAHRSKVMRKLKVRNVSELVRCVYEAAGPSE